MEERKNLQLARKYDEEDELKLFREKFHIPQINGKDSVYFTGNSLGLQPKSTKDYVLQELRDWANLGVEGHLKADNPWLYYHHMFSEPVSKIVGAMSKEVVVMNTLTVNLHLMMVSFYKPTKKRYKIMVEGHLFPSDQYAVESQLKFHGFDPKDGIIELMPGAGEYNLKLEDILDEIERHKDDLALILIGGVNYYTGQLFNMQEITYAGHKAGAIVGFDLAHAAGNVVMDLHDWDVDFAVWCSYKYLNSGPGGPGGIFVHERFGKDQDIPRFAGWWGYNEDTRFQMKKGFIPMEGAAGWQLSNAQILAMSAHKAAIDIFDEVGIDELRRKSEKLTGFLESLLVNAIEQQEIDVKIITPSDPLQRGCQLSLIASKNGKDLHKKLTDGGVIADWREPDVIRIAPVPLYNTFEDVYKFVELLKS